MGGYLNPANLIGNTIELAVCQSLWVAKWIHSLSGFIDLFERLVPQIKQTGTCYPLSISNVNPSS